MGNCWSFFCRSEPEDRSENIEMETISTVDFNASYQHECFSTLFYAQPDSMPPENFRATPFNLDSWTWPPGEKWKANLMQHAKFPELTRYSAFMDSTWDSHSPYQPEPLGKLSTAHTTLELVPMSEGSLAFFEAAEFELEEEAEEDDAPYDEFAEGIPISDSLTGLYTGSSNGSIVEIYMNSRYETGDASRLNHSFP